MIPLLLPHLLQDGHNPVLELAVVVIGDHQVANPVHSLLPEL